MQSYELDRFACHRGIQSLFSHSLSLKIFTGYLQFVIYSLKHCAESGKLLNGTLEYFGNPQQIPGSYISQGYYFIEWKVQSLIQVIVLTWQSDWCFG